MIDTLPEDIINLIFNNLEENILVNMIWENYFFENEYKFYIIIEKCKPFF